MHINIQPVEKQDRGDGLTLDVHSIFFTIQGEGPFTGQRAVFIRLAGCNLQCPKCDTDYTTDRQRMAVGDIVQQVCDLHPLTDERGLVVLTGGEPLRQNIAPLVNDLLFIGYRVQIETNGTLQLPNEIAGRVVVVCSPKTPVIHQSIQKWARAFKYVLSYDSITEDGLPVLALGHGKKSVVRPQYRNVDIYVQPCDDENSERNLQACIASVLEHGYTLQLQTHKIIGME